MFYLDSISAEDIGVYAEEENFLSRAPINYEEIKIDGKHGSEFIEKGFGNVVGKIRLFVKDKNKLDYAKSMFTGKRELKHNNRITTIRFYDINEVSRLGTIQELNVRFIRAPFWYKSNDQYVECKQNIVNEGNFDAQPIIKLVGSANSAVDISINGTRFVYKFDNNTEVEIDCKKQEETCNGVSKSSNMEIGFKYPILAPGNNTVIVNSGTANIYVKKKDVWL